MDFDTDLHPIQEKILKGLGYDGEKTFSEIQGDIESNKFAFHLNKLQEKELVEKTESGYKSTKKSREILPYFDLEDIRHPVIVVDLLVFAENKVYLIPKEDDPLDPFAGNYRAPSARISKNERLKEKAREIFREEFEREVTSMEESAVFDSEVKFSDGSRQHYLLFFFQTEIPEETKQFFELSELKEKNLLPGLEKVIKKTKWSDNFFKGKWDVVQTEDSFKVDKLQI